MKTTSKTTKRPQMKQTLKDQDCETSEISYNPTNEPPSTQSGESVSVSLRIRPMNSLEGGRGDKTSFKIMDDKSCQLYSNVLVGTTKQITKNFRFNHILYEKASQQNVYDTVKINDYLTSALDGYSVTVFAYGQTGSGKTYTMAGVEEKLSKQNFQLDEKDGIVPRAIKNLWSLIAKRKEKFSLKSSFCQIYNEQIKDLLNPTSGVLHCRWNSANGFFVEDLMIVDCVGSDDMIAVLNEGIKNRKSGSHEMNKDSSRSHSILTMYLISQNESSSQTIRKYGKVSFVDLAGSERLKQSKSQGVMAKETGNINKSLFTLGKVIKGLSDKKNKNPHIPYRDSKLTMLLMDSLGGTSKALMIACVSPSGTYYEQTLSTLNYATRTMNIKNKPAVQMNQKDQVMFGLMRERDLIKLQNQYLTQQIQRVQKGIKVQLPSFNKGPVQLPPIKVSANKSMSVPKNQKKMNSERGFYKQDQNQSGVGLDKIVKQYQYQLSRLETQNNELKNLRQISQKNYHNTHNDNHVLQIKLDNLENLFIKNGTSNAGNNIHQEYMNNNIIAENKSLRDRVSTVQEEMFSIQEQMKKDSMSVKNSQEELELSQAKAENRNLIDRVEFLQRREKEIMSAVSNK